MPALSASELRHSAVGLNLTLTLRGFDGTPSDFWDAEAISPSLIVSAFRAQPQQPRGFDELVRYGAPPAVSVLNETLTIHWPAAHFAARARRSAQSGSAPGGQKPPRSHARRTRRDAPRAGLSREPRGALPLHI